MIFCIFLRTSPLFLPLLLSSSSNRRFPTCRHSDDDDDYYKLLLLLLSLVKRKMKFEIQKKKKKKWQLCVGNGCAVCALTSIYILWMNDVLCSIYYFIKFLSIAFCIHISAREIMFYKIRVEITLAFAIKICKIGLSSSMIEFSLQRIRYLEETARIRVNKKKLNVKSK